MTDPLTIRVYGRPAPQGSHEQGANGYLMHSSAYLAAWRGAVNRDTRSTYLAVGITGADMPLIPYPRPVYIHRLEIIVGPEQCRAEGTDDPTGAPDLDKLLRATIDGLGEANAFGNDSQVIKCYELGKSRGITPGAIIVISDRPPVEREINAMDEYRISLERVTRDGDGDRVYETTFELFGSADQVASVGVATVAVLLGHPLAKADVTAVPTAPANEPDAPAEPPRKATRAKKAAAAPAEAAPAAPAAPPAPDGEPAVATVPQAPAEPAQPAARVNPFAK
jgi:hypothetical protein